MDRVGSALADPAAAMRRAAERRGGLLDAVALLALGLVATRAHALTREALRAADLDLASGMLGLARVAGGAVSGDLLAILVASVIVTAAVGRGRRDVARDADLAAVAWVPTFATRIAATLLGAAGAGGAAARALEAAGWAWSLALLVLGVRLVRRAPAEGGRA